MPKKSYTIETFQCKSCDRMIACRCYVRHMRTCNMARYLELEKEFSTLDPQRKCHCGISYPEFDKLNSYILYKLLGLDLNKKYCSMACFRKYNVVWNTGLSKETDNRVLKVAQKKMGKLNPIHKIIGDPEKKEAWVKSLEAGWADSEYRAKRAGRSNKEFYGKERAKEIFDIQSASQLEAVKKYPNRGMKNKHHSASTKKKCSIGTVKYNSSSLSKVSNLHKNFYNLLCMTFKDIEFEIEVGAMYYSIDIAITGLMIAIEVDGDYWHCNKSEGFLPVTAAHRKNLANDKRKNTYLKANGWNLLRFWETDINNNIDSVLKQVKDAIDGKLRTR